VTEITRVTESTAVASTAKHNDKNIAVNDLQQFKKLWRTKFGAFLPEPQGSPSLSKAARILLWSASLNP